MAEGNDNGDRTEAATPRHLDQAREHGNVPVSREATAFVSLGAVVLVLANWGPDMGRRMMTAMAVSLGRVGDGPNRAAEVALSTIATVALPVLAVAAIAAGAAVLAQTNFLLHPNAAEPNFARVNPAAGLRRVFGFNGLVEAIRSIAKLVVIGVALYVAASGDWVNLKQLPWLDPGTLAGLVGRQTLRLLIAAVCAQAVIGGVDLAWVRFHFARDLRMSKQDLRDEFRDTEGNPHIKARIRRLRVGRARRRMMAKVPTATAVITNPTHYAVAIAYDRATQAAPRVVAKGINSLAARIRAVAEANFVPIVPNPPLARALHRLELDTEIPPEYYKAVAEIIAYVWRLRGVKRPW